MVCMVYIANITPNPYGRNGDTLYDIIIQRVNLGKSYGGSL